MPPLPALYGPRPGTPNTDAHAVLVGDVDGEEHRLTPGGADALDVLLALVDRAAAEDDLGALFGEHLRHRAADAARGTGDQCDLAFEPRAARSRAIRSHD